MLPFCSRGRSGAVLGANMRCEDPGVIRTPTAEGRPVPVDVPDCPGDLSWFGDRFEVAHSDHPTNLKPIL